MASLRATREIRVHNFVAHFLQRCQVGRMKCRLLCERCGTVNFRYGVHSIGTSFEHTIVAITREFESRKGVEKIMKEVGRAQDSFQDSFQFCGVVTVQSKTSFIEGGSSIDRIWHENTVFRLQRNGYREDGKS